MSWKPRPVRTSSRITVNLGPSVGRGKSACITSCAGTARALVSLCQAPFLAAELLAAVHVYINFLMACPSFLKAGQQPHLKILA